MIQSAVVSSSKYLIWVIIIFQDCPIGKATKLKISPKLASVGPEMGLKWEMVLMAFNSICMLHNLHTLRLNCSYLTQLPCAIGNMRNLITLELRENSLINLPDSICDLENLVHLDLEGIIQNFQLPLWIKLKGVMNHSLNIFWFRSIKIFEWSKFSGNRTFRVARLFGNFNFTT